MTPLVRDTRLPYSLLSTISTIIKSPRNQRYITVSDTHSQISDHLEQIKKCPYCRDKVLSRSLYGHVAFSKDDEHGPRGEVPEGFSTEDAETTGHQLIKTKVMKASDPDERIRCKWCEKDFAGKHGLKTHLAMVTPDEDHPENLNPETSGIRIPSRVANVESDEEIEPLIEESHKFHHALNKLSGERTKTGDEQGVPLSELEDLLDELRMKEPEGAAYVTCARMLNDVIQKHR